ncbi:peptide ABC transporter substrate-binding protein [Lactobacillus amylovorus]|jgi:oligopeptide transport system substrate-binding protein|uniref:Peptide ABC transporter substrate-binding protein n=1 Tax=Lactobacillus amylovorus subsp. animalium TaxID=3378536 RepID=A0ABC9VLP7_LACAM|nr:peptide ABC transporter substrate-binding protein [Lactobacillus amylovorus]RGW88304.1 peptide ABC transporter substrate-binding protein [Lactobacillus amylovorus]
MKNWLKSLSFGALTAGVVATLSACSNNSTSGASQSYKKSMSWMTTSEVQTLDPDKMVDTASGEQANNVFEGLNRLNNKNQVVPGVATTTTQSKDGLTWTFKLRKNAKWSNGDPVTAQDFVYSMRRKLDPKTKSQQQNHFDSIVNAPEVMKGTKKPSSLGVEAKDKYTLVVHLTHATPYFKTLTATGWNPEDEKVVKKYGDKYGTASKYMVYNGPFTSSGWTGTNLSWKLKKNNQYWDKNAVKLDTVNYSVQKTPSTDYNLYQANKLDGAYLDTQGSKQLKNQSGYHVFKLDRTEYLTYNVSKNKDLANVNLRRAFSMALNRKSLAQTVGAANTVATTFSGPQETVGNTNFNNYAEKHLNNQYVTYNKAEAKKSFDKALKQLGKSKVSFTLTGDDDDVSKKVTEFVQSALEDTFGKKVDVQVRNMTKTTRVSNMLNGNYDVDYTGLSTDFNDPYAMLSVMMTGQSYNFGKWSNRQYDQYLNDSNKELNNTKRLDYFLKATQVMNDEQPLTPLYHDGQAWMVRNSVHNLGFTSSSFNFRDTYVTR